MMANIDELTVAVGSQADSDVVLKLLKEFGFDDRVTIKRGDTDVYLNNKQMGISLLLESERHIHSKHGVNFPTDAPVLTAIFLYGPNDDEFSEYQGRLPGGLRFSDDQSMAIGKLGASTKYNADRGSELWDLPDGIRFFVRYADVNKTIARVQFGILWR